VDVRVDEPRRDEATLEIDRSSRLPTGRNRPVADVRYLPGVHDEPAGVDVIRTTGEHLAAAIDDRSAPWHGAGR